VGNAVAKQQQPKSEPKPARTLNAAPPDPEGDIPVELTISEHYAGFSVQELATAATKAQDELAAVEQELATADTWLSEAIKRDEQEFNPETGGPEVASHAPHYRAAKDRLLDELPSIRWRLQRRAAALSMAARLAKIGELTAEIEERHPRIGELEEQVRKLQEELSTLRYQQQDALDERRDISVSKHEAEAYRQLSGGPQIRGLAAALLTGNGAAAGPGWSPNRIEF